MMTNVTFDETDPNLHASARQSNVKFFLEHLGPVTTVPELAEFLRISQQSVLSLIQAKAFPVLKGQRMYRIPTAGVAEYYTPTEADDADPED